jgi:transcriptional regulator with XRE-family HTH domain
MITPSRLWDRLRNPKYRGAFVATQVKRGVPFQIRAMRKKLGWTQEQLADRSALPQPTISRAEDLNYGNLTIRTLLAIARGFDTALQIKFVPFSQLAQSFSEMSEESAQVATFGEEDGAQSETHSSIPTPSAPAKPVEAHYGARSDQGGVTVPALTLPGDLSALEQPAFH